MKVSYATPCSFGSSTKKPGIDDADGNVTVLCRYFEDAKVDCLRCRLLSIFVQWKGNLLTHCIVRSAKDYGIHQSTG